MSVRKKLLQIHRWTGIALAALLVIAGITGSLLSFHHEIDALLNPGLHRIELATKRAALDSIAKTIEAKYPGLVVGYFLFPGDAQSFGQYFSDSTTWVRFFFHGTLFGLTMGFINWRRNEKAFAGQKTENT